jgi:hypothetical protein
MQVAEMRSSLEADHARRGLGELPSMPDWCTKYIYERRHKLPLSPLPARLRSLTVTAKSAMQTQIVVDDDPDGEKEKLRLMAEALKLL